MLGEISFAGKVGYNIKSEDIKKKLLDDLQNVFRFKIIQKHHERFSEEIIPKLNTNPHLAGVRTNGNPYLLVLTRVNFVNQCIFVDKKIQQGYFYPRMIVSRFRFDDILFGEGGTVFDGEMIKTTSGKWLFLIGDVIGYRGAHLENANLVKRLNLLYDTLQKHFDPEPSDVCSIQVKRYFTYDNLSTLYTEFVPSLPYTCRGIVFKPLFLKFKDILYNFDDSLVVKVMRKKYKNVSNFLLDEHITQHPTAQDTSESGSTVSFEASVDTSTDDLNPDQVCCGRRMFMVQKCGMPDVYELIDPESRKVQIACVPSMAQSKFMRKIFEDKNVNDKVAMMCEQLPNFGMKWVPVEVIE